MGHFYNNNIIVLLVKILKIIKLYGIVYKYCN